MVYLFSLAHMYLETNNWFQVLVDMIRVPDWAFETAAGQEMRGMGQDTASYHPGLYLTEPQVQLIMVHETPQNKNLTCV